MGFLSKLFGGSSGPKVMNFAGQRIDGKKFADKNFAGQDMTNAGFKECNFSGTSFANVNLTDARFDECNLSGTDFTGAILNSTRFEKCVLDGSVFKPSSHNGLRLDECSGVDAVAYRKEIALSFLSKIDSAIPGGTIKQKKDDDDTIQMLMMKMGNWPVRVSVKYDDDSDSVEGRWSIDVKFTNRVGMLFMEWTEENTVGERDEDDAWSDDDEIRFFYGKNVSHLGDKSIQDLCSASFNGLDPTVAATLVNHVRATKTYFVAGTDNMTFLGNCITENPDTASIIEVLKFIETLAGSFEAGTQDFGDGPFMIVGGELQNGKKEPSKLKNCGYCKATYLINTTGKCPVCGGA